MRKGLRLNVLAFMTKSAGLLSDLWHHPSNLILAGSQLLKLLQTAGREARQLWTWVQVKVFSWRWRNRVKERCSLWNLVVYMLDNVICTWIVSSRISRFRFFGMKPAPIPWILCAPGLPPDMTGLSEGSTATTCSCLFYSECLLLKPYYTRYLLSGKSFWECPAIQVSTLSTDSLWLGRSPKKLLMHWLCMASYHSEFKNISH